MSARELSVEERVAMETAIERLVAEVLARTGTHEAERGESVSPVWKEEAVFRAGCHFEAALAAREEAPAEFRALADHLHDALAFMRSCEASGESGADHSTVISALEAYDGFEWGCPEELPGEQQCVVRVPGGDRTREQLEVLGIGVEEAAADFAPHIGAAVGCNFDLMVIEIVFTPDTILGSELRGDGQRQTVSAPGEYEYRLSWECPSAACVMAHHDLIWKNLTPDEWDGLPWERSLYRIADGGDIFTQRQTLEGWAEDHYEPVRNVRFERRVRPNPDEGWSDVAVRGATGVTHWKTAESASPGMGDDDGRLTPAEKQVCHKSAVRESVRYDRRETFAAGFIAAKRHFTEVVRDTEREHKPEQPLIDWDALFSEFEVSDEERDPFTRGTRAGLRLGLSQAREYIAVSERHAEVLAKALDKFFCDAPLGALTMTAVKELRATVEPTLQALGFGKGEL